MQQLLLVTMISRVAKILLRASMRNINNSADAPFFAALVEYVPFECLQLGCLFHFSLFNLLLGTSDASTRFWTTDVKIYVLAKFDGYGGSLNDGERSRNYDLRLQVRATKIAYTHITRSCRSRCCSRLCATR